MEKKKVFGLSSSILIMVFQVICSHTHDLIVSAFGERKNMNSEFNDRRASYVSVLPSELNEEKLCKESSKNIENRDTKKTKGNTFYLWGQDVNKRQQREYTLFFI